MGIVLIQQHCDFYWAAEAVEWAYLSMLDDLEATRPRYPEEEGEERDPKSTETEGVIPDLMVTED